MMKSILFNLCILMVSTPALAQIPRGTSTLGGSLSASYSRRVPDAGDFHSTSIWSISLKPDYGYFVATNFCIGASVAVWESRSETDTYYNVGQRDNDAVRSIQGGPFIRYYLPVDQKLYAWGAAYYQWGYSYNYYEMELVINHDDHSMISWADKGKTSTWGLAAGLSYFISNPLAADLGLDFSHAVNNNTPTINRLALNVGLRLLLFKKDKKSNL